MLLKCDRVLFDVGHEMIFEGKAVQHTTVISAKASPDLEAFFDPKNQVLIVGHKKLAGLLFVPAGDVKDFFINELTLSAYSDMLYEQAQEGALVEHQPQAVGVPRWEDLTDAEKQAGEAMASAIQSYNPTVPEASSGDDRPGKGARKTVK